MYRPDLKTGKVDLIGLATISYCNVRKVNQIRPLKRVELWLILIYQKFLSRKTCLYTPTCSQYMAQSIQNNGPVIGVLLGIWRLLRCNPFSKGGYDPAKENLLLSIWLI